MNRVWPYRDPASHARAPAALQSDPPDRTVPSQHELQALQAQLDAFQRARTRDRDRLQTWRRALQRLVEQIAPLAFHDRLRQQPDFGETGTPDAWLALAEPVLAELQDRARPAAPLAAAGPPASRGWCRTDLPDPPANTAGPKDPRDQGTLGFAALGPAPDPPVAEPPPAAEGPATDRTAPAAAPPECPVQGTPWFRDWDGAGSLADRIGQLRGTLRRWGVHDKPTVPDNIAWRGGDTWVREMVLLCLMAETGMAAARQLQLALARRAGVADPFKRAGSQNQDLQALAAKQLVATDQLQVANGKGASVPLNIVWLTDAGRALIARHTALRAVESEWPRLERLHGGAHQRQHNARVMLAAAGLRTWGWQVEVLPDLEDADPDLLITAPGLELPWPTEVEAGAGSEERRHRKWRVVAGLHADDPRICLIAPEPHSLLRMAREIRQSAPKARILCGDLRTGFGLPAGMAAARALPLPLRHLEPCDSLAPLAELARDTARAVAQQRKPAPRPQGGTP